MIMISLTTHPRKDSRFTFEKRPDLLSCIFQRSASASARRDGRRGGRWRGNPGDGEQGEDQGELERRLSSDSSEERSSEASKVETGRDRVLSGTPKTFTRTSGERSGKEQRQIKKREVGCWMDKTVRPQTNTLKFLCPFLLLLLKRERSRACGCAGGRPPSAPPVEWRCYASPDREGLAS